MLSTESNLLRFGKEVIGVAVERHAANPFYWHAFFRDELGTIQQIKLEVVFIFFLHDLKAKVILGVVSGFNGFPQVSAVIVGVLSR